jgi:hypothetical protein
MSVRLSFCLANSMTTGRIAKRLGTHRLVPSGEKYSSMSNRMRNNREFTEQKRSNEENE